MGYNSGNGNLPFYETDTFLHFYAVCRTSTWITTPRAQVICRVIALISCTCAHIGLKISDAAILRDVWVKGEYKYTEMKI